MTTTDNPTRAASFAELGLTAARLAAISAAGYTAPTEIQWRTIPIVLQGRDVVGQSRTGTGKTAAFMLPILDRITPSGPTQALVIAPTRELALQSAGEAQKFGEGKYRVGALYGGQPLVPQLTQLAHGLQVVVGTPGRLLDHIRRRSLDLSQLKVLVLDECDRMLDLGFRDDIDDIVRRTPNTRQTLLFSATISDEVMRLAARYLRDPEKVFVAPERMTVDEVDQVFISVEKDRKVDLLLEVLRRENPPMTVVFARTRAAVKGLAPRLARAGVDASEIHGDLDQRQRERVLNAFREGKIRVLVATDVASRGLDISGISHIVNYDLPDDPEDYVHRIGRTARMGRRGRALAFVTPDQGMLLTAIEKLINREIVCENLEGFEAVAPRSTESRREFAPIGWKSPSVRRRRKRR